jgi:hypothetical protein
MKNEQANRDLLIIAEVFASATGLTILFMYFLSLIV